ncbi:RsfA family transcriptional regulator [Aeribacillus pallidus]|uniref:RsfA family transcriptional regulator n=1 Tax=Aeribacillus pallidus TaxID=33936 RepID=UPI003D1CF8E7
MTGARQDAWTQDEDLLLAEVVLRHIREGSTQLKAFEEVGKKLSRTPAACGFRWNSYVRKQYQSGIELAKKRRKELKKETSQRKEETALATSSLSISQIITYLKKIESDISSVQKIQEEKSQLQYKYNQLQEENKKLHQENEQLIEKLETLSEDYRIMLNLMEKARKLALNENSEEKKNVKFQMDKNGNLHRVEK